MIFSIVTKSGDRYDYTDPALQWQYGLAPGSLDVEDRSIVEVIRETDDETETVARYNDVLAVGDVPDISMICREGAELLAMLFSNMTNSQKESVPRKDALRIGDFMVKNGYHMVFKNWYKQTDPDPSALA